jgi:hypothetical protein
MKTEKSAICKFSGLADCQPAKTVDDGQPDDK